MYVANKPLQLFAVAQLEEPDDFRMLFVGLAQQAVQLVGAHVGVLPLHEVAVHLVNQPYQARIAALAHIAVVEVVLQVVVFLVEALLDGQLHGTVQELQLRDVVGGHVAHGQQRGAAVQRADDLHDFAGAVLRHALDVEALARHVLQVTVGGQLDERLAHGRAADAERIAYLLLADLVIVGQSPAVDQVDDVVVYMVFEGTVFVRHFIRLSYGLRVCQYTTSTTAHSRACPACTEVLPHSRSHSDTHHRPKNTPQRLERVFRAMMRSAHAPRIAPEGIRGLTRPSPSPNETHHPLFNNSEKLPVSS